MNTEHILLQKSLKYRKRKEIETPKNYSFNSIVGAWINNSDQSFLIQSSDFNALGSKKEDIETGEDQKGQ